MKKINLVIFVEGTFLPALDGYSLTMSNICNILAQDRRINLTLIHCYRRWTDIKILKKQKYRIILVSPDAYYHKTSEIIKLLDVVPDIIQMQDAELILSQGVKLREYFKCKLIYHPHYIASRLAQKLHIKNEVKKKVAANEKTAAYYADYIFCFTSYDKEYFCSVYRADPVKIIIVSPAIQNNDCRFEFPAKNNRNLIFVGNLFFQANADALAIVLRDIYPEIEHIVKNFFIIGAGPKSVSNKYKRDSKIKFLGTVKNIHKYLHFSRLAIFPILEPSGIRTKVLTCFTNGVPVIGYKAAFEGLAKNKTITHLASDENKILIKKAKSLILNCGKAKRIAQEQKNIFDRLFSNEKLNRMYYKHYRNMNKPVNRPKIRINSKKFTFTEPAWLQEFKLKKKTKSVYDKLSLPLKINVKK